MRSDLTLEAIAEEMRRLNEQTPGRERPDMVVVASAGLIQYSAQFPGENVSGDFILPGEKLSYAPPMYIHGDEANRPIHAEQDVVVPCRPSGDLFAGVETAAVSGFRGGRSEQRYDADQLSVQPRG